MMHNCEVKMLVRKPESRALDSPKKARGEVVEVGVDGTVRQPGHAGPTLSSVRSKTQPPALIYIIE